MIQYQQEWSMFLELARMIQLPNHKQNDPVCIDVPDSGRFMELAKSAMATDLARISPRWEIYNMI